MTLISACRACDAPDLAAILSLGNTPLANSLRHPDSSDAPELTYPLDVVFCRSCSLVQLTETVDPEILFRDYLYLSSFSDTMLRHASDLVSSLIEDRALGPNNLAVEIASNDGYLLKNYVAAGVPVLGIEPATNVARIAEEQGIRTRNDFFNARLARMLVSEGYGADVIHAHNVLAHVADLHGVVEGIVTLLDKNGVAVLEMPYVKDMIDQVEFDTIYHEHLCYFSLTAINRLFQRHGLTVTKVDRVPIHGGTLRVFASHAGQAAVADRSVAALLEEESSWATNPEAYARFGDRVVTIGAELRRMIAELKAAGKRVAAYGAAAKGSTLLNYLGIGRESLDFVVDRSTFKQGLLMPGVHIPILPPEALLDRRPDYVLLLSWNFADEIMHQQADYRALGGQFILPVPFPRVV